MVNNDFWWENELWYALASMTYRFENENGEIIQQHSFSDFSAIQIPYDTDYDFISHSQLGQVVGYEGEGFQLIDEY